MLEETSKSLQAAVTAQGLIHNSEISLRFTAYEYGRFPVHCQTVLCYISSQNIQQIRGVAVTAQGLIHNSEMSLRFTAYEYGRFPVYCQTVRLDSCKLTVRDSFFLCCGNQCGVIGATTRILCV
ncbi:hypothetical protein J6590_062853 [Homalodisca vitripennis]|nr:hypothetical protein J6590_062853 [Homalodisca vitripennis]